MKVLVTGGKGFLGTHLQKFLISNDENQFWFPSKLELNCLNEEWLIDFIQEKKIDIILHMAAKCGGISANKNSPADFLRDNTQMALNIYEAGRKANVSHIYSLGTVCAYPKFCQPPFNEDDIWNGAPEETNFPYSQAKRTLILLSQSYRAQYNIKGAHLIPSNLYGENDHFQGINNHVIPALITKIDNAITNDISYIECWGSGEASREFLYAGDAATIIAKSVLLNFDYNLPINIGTEQEIKIKDLVNLIVELMEYKGKIIFNGKLDGQPRRSLNIERIKRLLNWEPKVQLKEGLIKTIQWYKSNRE